MERLEAHVPPPMKRDIKRFQQREGYENQSQAIRELIRRGLSNHQRPNRPDLESALDTVGLSPE